MKLVLQLSSLGLALSLSTAAFATKALDDKLAAVQKDGKYTSSLANIKTNCGCAPAVSIDAKSYKEAQDMNRIAYAIESVATASKGYCSADKYKKAFCSKVKTLHITYAKTVATAALEHDTLNLTSNNTGYTGDKSVAKLLEPLAD